MWILKDLIFNSFFSTFLKNSLDTPVEKHRDRIKYLAVTDNSSNKKECYLISNLCVQGFRALAKRRRTSSASDSKSESQSETQIQTTVPSDSESETSNSDDDVSYIDIFF